MFVNKYTICLVLSCVVLYANSDGYEQNYLEKKVYAIESSLEADIHFLRKEVRANTEQVTKLVNLLNNTIQLINSRSENDIVNKQQINSDDQSRGTMQHSDILQEIKKVASETSRNKRAIREEKQVAREVYSKLATSTETLQTSLQESITRAELFQEKLVENIQNEIASKFDEIKIQNDEIRQEIKVNTDEIKIQNDEIRQEINVNTDEIKNVTSETILNRRAILEVKQVSTDIYSKLATSIETQQTSLQESITRAELFQEKSVKNLQNEMASKFDEIKAQNNEIRQEITVNTDETKKVVSETARNRRDMLEVKQVSTDIYSNLTTSTATLQTSLQESITRAELFQETLVENLQNEMASKFDEIKAQNNEIRQEIKVNIGETEIIKTDVSLIKLVTVLDTLNINPLQNAQALCNGRDEVILERCDSFVWFGNEIDIRQHIPHIQQSRLSNMSEIPNGVQGRLEVYYNGEWGTVCDDGFNDVDATVACKNIGYAKGSSHINPSHTFNPLAEFGNGEGKIWMDDVACTGTESSLFKCPMNKLGEEDCGHNEDVGVSCFK